LQNKAYFQMSDADDSTTNCWYPIASDHKAYKYIDTTYIDILNDETLQTISSTSTDDSNKLRFATSDCSKLVPAQHLQLPTFAKSDTINSHNSLVDNKLQVACHVYRRGSADEQTDNIIEYSIAQQTGMPLDVYIDNEKAVEFTSSVHHVPPPQQVASSVFSDVLLDDAAVRMCDGSNSVDILSKKENAAMSFILIAKMESLATKFYLKTKWMDILGKDRKKSKTLGIH